jgi:hypothetical protein
VNSLYSVFRTFSSESNLQYVNHHGIWNDADAKVLANRNSTADDAFRADMLGSKWNMRRTLITEFVRRLSSIAMSENNNFKKPGLIVFDLGKIIQRYFQNFETEHIRMKWFFMQIIRCGLIMLIQRLNCRFMLKSKNIGK